jgi:hypothetical protein
MRGRATATVLSIQANNFHNTPVTLDGGWSVNNWYVQVHIHFIVGADHELAVLNWPSDKNLPGQGTKLAIAYDPAKPEYLPILADQVSSPQPDSHGREPAWPGLAAAITGALALIAVLVTVSWARRAAVTAPTGPDWNQSAPTSGNYLTPPN